MAVISSPPKKHHLSLLLMISIIIVCTSFAATGHGKEIISGRYVSISGSQITFSINVAAPAPANLIVQHFHPADVKLQGTTPVASKVSSTGGSVKWFIKAVEPGTLSFSLSFNKAVSKNSVKAVLRYRDPTTGNFTESIVLP